MVVLGMMFIAIPENNSHGNKTHSCLWSDKQKYLSQSEDLLQTKLNYNMINIAKSDKTLQLLIWEIVFN